MDSEQQWLQLGELSFALGQELLIYPDPANNTRTYSCSLAGYLPGDALLVTASEGVDLASIGRGQGVVVRMNLLDGVALFPTTAMFSVQEPKLLLYLAAPKSVKFRQVRSAMRVDVTLPVLADNLDRTSISGVPGKIKDLSETGAQLVMYQPLAEVGERIQLKGKFTVNGIARALVVQGVIRKERVAEQHIYGVELFEGTEEQRLILSNFILHAMAFGRTQHIR